MSSPVLVELVRSGFVESVHTGSVLAVRPDGSRALELGAAEALILPRSANKPLQAVALLEAGWAPASDQQLALACASHSGEPRHLEVVASMLAGAGLDERDLQCPAQLPLGEHAEQEWLRAGKAANRLAMNCSGKHAAMLACCVGNGWSTADYLDAGHPLQRALNATVGRLAGEPVRHVAVDGCGAPQHALSLAGLAQGFAAVVTGAGACAQVAAAVRAHPGLMGGEGRDVTLLLSGVQALVAKDGAEGVYAAALPDGAAVAVKVHDGSTRAAPLLLCAGLRALGVRAPVLDELGRVAVLGGGLPVGHLQLAGPLASS